MARWPRFLTRNREKASTAAELSPPDLEVRVENRGETVLLELSGELDIDTKLKLKGELVRAEATGPTAIVVDLRGLTFMDSMGHGVLLGALRRARTGGWRLVLVKGPEPIERLLQITGVGNLVEVVDDADAAGDGGGNGAE